jgi:hypothetical protein
MKGYYPRHRPVLDLVDAGQSRNVEAARSDKRIYSRIGSPIGESRGGVPDCIQPRGISILNSLQCLLAPYADERGNGPHYAAIGPT